MKLYYSNLSPYSRKARVIVRELDIKLLEGQNSAAVDLFPLRHAEKVLAISRRYRTALPLYIMTSPDNDAATQAFFFEQGRAADLFAQPFDFSLVHLPSPDSPQATSGPFLGWSRLFQALRNIPDRPRSLPDARAR